MPSSMIFAGLVVLWLLILVPAVARHRQEVVRPSVAALSGRVLERPRRRRSLEVDGMGPEDRGVLATHGEPEPEQDDQRDLIPAQGGPVDEAGRAGDGVDDRVRERAPRRYRPGRGGFDAEAAAVSAQARYAFRQRVVLSLLVAALVTAVIAAVAAPGLWWLHVAVDLALVAYLVYLRRQVRMEEAIRERRAARMAGTRRSPAAGDPALDDRDHDADDHDLADRADIDDERDDDIDGAADEPAEITGETFDEDADEDGSAEPVAALPRLQPAPPPPLPEGTSLVGADDAEFEMAELDDPPRRDYRRAAGA